ncbi:hypothetical protein [Streptacidiphilus sp. MAP5-3]|jgi:hypothetical protein|uniref:hypothetical protein n=1 Tax=unclassified Streptacidiphilus TaxID=2643834 RepID=UPI00351523FF
MAFLRRRSGTPAGPDFDVLAMDPGDWPGDLGAVLLSDPEDGTCQGVVLRYDLMGGRGPSMLIGNLRPGSPAREPEDGVPFEVRQMLAAVGNDEPVGVLDTEDFPVMLDDALLIVKKVKLTEGRLACVQFGRSDDIQVTVVTWDRPISEDLYKLLKPLPADMFQV